MDERLRSKLLVAAFVLIALTLTIDMALGIAHDRDPLISRSDLFLCAILAGAGGLAIRFGKDGFEVNPAKTAEHLERAEKKQRREMSPSAAKSHAQRVKLKKRARILWVDDEPPNNIDETLMLESLGIDVSQATTTETGLEYLRDVRFDVVITDLTRDGNRRAGLELLERIPQVRAGTKCLVYAGGIDERAAEAEKLGARAVTTAPLGLLQAVVSALS
jgi:CheY-like chemotaxis protein